MINKIWVIMRKNKITKEEYPFQMFLDEKTAKETLEWINKKECILQNFQKEKFVITEFNRNY